MESQPNALSFEELREKHQVGRHLLAFADGDADWCRRCGTFDFYLTHSECEPKPRVDRFWPQRKKKDVT